MPPTTEPIDTPAAPPGVVKGDSLLDDGGEGVDVAVDVEAVEVVNIVELEVELVLELVLVLEVELELELTEAVDTG